MKTLKHIMLLAVLLLTACSGQYKGMPREELLAYQTRATYGELHSLAVAYAEAINAAVKEDTLHPGMYADYGVTLALMGHTGTACRMLNAEAAAFPESRGMVRRLKQQLMPDLMDDTLAPFRDTANIAQLLGWAYDSLAALQPLPGVASVVDSSDTAWLRVQTPVDSVQQAIRLSANEKRELLVKQQNEAKMRRQYVADSVAAAKQAKIDARKQAKVDKEKAKKEKAKAKAKADKEKKKQQKQLQKERKQQADAKKQQAAEQTKAKKQAEKEKAKQRAEQAKAKKQAEKQKAEENDHTEKGGEQ